MATKKTKNFPGDDELLKKFKAHLSEGEEYFGSIHEDFNRFKKFAVVEDGQWTQDEKDRMGEPVMQINRMLPYINLIVNAAIQKEIGCLVEPVSEGASEKLAMVRQAQIMKLWNMANGVAVSGLALRELIWGGYCVLKMTTKFSNSTGFDKTLKWESLSDPTKFMWDTTAQDPGLADMEWAIEKHELSKRGYQKRYGDIDRLDRKSENIFEKNGKQIVYEYWFKITSSHEEGATISGDRMSVKEAKRLGLELITDDFGEPITRRVENSQVWQIVIGNNKIHKKVKWDGSRLPYKVGEGRKVVYSGKTSYQAMITQAMNPQKKLNFIESQKSILFSKGPQEIVFVPAETYATSLNEKLNEVVRNGSNNVTVIPYRSLTEDGKQIPAPNFKAQILGDPVLMQEGDRAISDIEACFGMSPTAWLNPNPSASGKAQEVRAEQGETSNFDFVKNWLVMLEESFIDAMEIIPKLGISTQIKLSGGLASEKTVWVNNEFATEQSGAENFDIDEGEEYALTIKVSPAEKSARELAYDQLIKWAKMFPEKAGAIADLILKSGMNNMYSEQAAARIVKTIPPELLDENVDPRMQMMQQQLQMAQQTIAGLEQQLQASVEAVRRLNERLKIEKQKAGNELLIKNMETELDKMKLELDEQKLNVERFKAETERMQAEKERLETVLSPAAQISQGGI